MSTKRAKELKNLTKNELETKLRESESELFQARLQKATGQLGDTAKTWRIRKDIARMKTFLAQTNAGATASQKATR